jgi:hypothetical protein
MARGWRGDGSAEKKIKIMRSAKKKDAWNAATSRYGVPASIFPSRGS